MSQVYAVRELDNKGVVINATYTADTEGDVIQMIRSKGHIPVKVSPAKQAPKAVEFKFMQRVKLKDLSVFCKQMSTMLHAGMPLIESLNVIAAQTDNKKLKDVVGEIVVHVQRGEVLSTGMRLHPKVFPSILISMIEAGEMTGNLDDALDKMALHFNKEHKINEKVKGAMIYPAFIGVLAVSAVIFLLVKVMPTFIGMFESSGAELPGITQLLIRISDFIQAYWYVIIGVIALIVYAIRRYIATDNGKYNYDSLLLKLPMIKGPIAKIATARFTRTLSTLLSSGIPLLSSLETAGSVTNNKIVMRGIEQVSDEIKKGKSLSSLLSHIKIFPPMMTSMIRIGEESGSLEEMLNKSADFYEEELEEAIKRLTALIEPTMIVIMAGMVGFIVVAMMMPMFDMFQALQK